MWWAIRPGWHRESLSVCVTSHANLSPVATHRQQSGVQSPAISLRGLQELVEQREAYLNRVANSLKTRFKQEITLLKRAYENKEAQKMNERLMSVFILYSKFTNARYFVVKTQFKTLLSFFHWKKTFFSCPFKDPVKSKK